MYIHIIIIKFIMYINNIFYILIKDFLKIILYDFEKIKKVTPIKIE